LRLARRKVKVNVHVHEAGYYGRTVNIEDGQIPNGDVWRNVNDAAVYHENGHSLTNRRSRPVNEASVMDDQISHDQLPDSACRVDPFWIRPTLTSIAG
jgi:hypothetical protein